MAVSAVTPGKARPRLGRSFAALWAATGLANLGDGFYLLALPLVAVELTNSAGLVAGVTAMMTLGWPVFGLYAGVIVDRTDRRRLIVAVNAIRALALAGLTAALLTDTASIPLVYGVALLMGVGETLVDTSLAAVVPQAVPDRALLGRANARIEVAQNVTNQFIGPPLGGLLATAGLAWVTGSSAVLYAGTLGCLAMMRGSYRATPAPTTGHPPEREPMRSALLAGIAFTWRHALLRRLTLMTAAMNVFWAAWVSVLVLYLVDPAHVGLSTTGYGILLTTMALGGIAGAIVVEPLRRRLGAHRLLALDVVGTIVLIGTPALTTNPIAIGAAMFVGGAGSAVWRVIVALIRQAVTPGDVLGRVYSANRMISWGVLPFGALLGGLVAEFAGVRAVFAVGGIASLGLLAVYARTVRPADLAAALAD